MDRHESPRLPKNPNRGAIEIAVLYLLLGGLWILLSDKGAQALAGNNETLLVTISLYKGWGYVIVTGLLLYGLIQGHTAALRTSEAQLQQVIDALPVLISYVDADGHYRFTNRTYEEWFGASAHGKTLREVTGEEAYKTISKYVDRVLAGETVTYEDVLSYPRGERFINATCIPDKAPDGKVKGFFVLVHDMTESKRTREELRQWADAFNDCAHGIGIGVPGTNRMVVCNPAFAALHHCRVEDLVGATVLSLYDPADHEYVRHNIAKADQAGHVRYESTMLRRDGSTFPVQVDLVSVRDEKGKILHRVATVQDISERKQAERALRESQIRLNFALEKSHTGGWDLDLVDHTALRTLEHDRIFGYETLLPQWTYERFLEHVLPEDRAEVDRLFQEATSTRTDWSFECRIRRKDGEVRWIWAIGGHLFDDTGQAYRLAGIVQDITERKQAEQEIRLLNERLEHRVIERTAQLESANKELEAFSYSVSHDLRAPLRAIDGYSRILVEDYAAKLDDEGKRICSVISGEARRMGQLIDDLLAFSRLGRKEMHSSRIDMKALATSVFGELIKAEDPGRIDFQITRLPAVDADPSLIRQVWVNLLANAIKFTSKKKHAFIKVGTRPSPNEYIYYVQDTGAGFDMEYVDKLFGVFQRLHGESEFEGTGVGLAIVQRIVRRHGGRVWAEGEPGKGATFYFALPRQENHHD